MELSNIIILVKTAFWSTVHSLSRAHSYPFSPSRDTSLGGSRTQLSLGEEESLEISTEESETKKRVDKKVDEEKEEWGVVLESPSLPEESKTDSLMTLQRWGFTQDNTMFKYVFIGSQKQRIGYMWKAIQGIQATTTGVKQHVTEMEGKMIYNDCEATRRWGGNGAKAGSTTSLKQNRKLQYRIQYLTYKGKKTAFLKMQNPTIWDESLFWVNTFFIDNTC